MRLLLLSIMLICALARTFPMYKQCDPTWRDEQLGTSSNTICSAGCLMCSAAMALTGAGHSFTPPLLNSWLTTHNGYVSGDLFVWASINSLGLVFEGKVSNSEIKAKLDQNKIVICNVHNGKHWVLATGYSGDNIFINDPNYTTPSYALNEIVEGQNGVYHVDIERVRAAVEKMKKSNLKIKHRQVQK